MWSSAFIANFRITERESHTFQTEMSDAFNLVNLSKPGDQCRLDLDLRQIRTTNAMRQVQFGLRFAF